MKKKYGKIVMAVGGTGGHIYPALALTQEIEKIDPELLINFIVDYRPLAYRVFSSNGYHVNRIASSPLPRKKVYNICMFIVKIIIGTAESLILLKKIKPDIMVAFGAYISVPAVFAAFICGVPVILHEQNYFPGLANKFLTFMAKHVAISYKASIKYFPADKTVLTGNPVRKVVLDTDRKKGIDYFGLDERRITIMVFGGSLGSYNINSALMGALPYLEEYNDKLQFIHICGNKLYRELLEHYSKFQFSARIYKYLEPIENAYSVADIILARAGATTIAEIAAIGIPAIFIPYSESTSQHQFLNTKPLCKLGGAICYNEDELGGEGLALRLRSLIMDDNKRRDMKIRSGMLSERFTQASARLAQLVMKNMRPGSGKR
ncbi:undecaprenyldiphospho-muramoylpentapeptide beta-N-acetylglucosaminyltransferase [Elusimicrobiota bacterium]